MISKHSVDIAVDNVRLTTLLVCMQVAGHMIMLIHVVSGMMLNTMETVGAADACLKTLTTRFGGLCLVAFILAWLYKWITVKVTSAAL